MATEHYLDDDTFIAENTLAASQFYFVELGTGANQVDVCDAATDLPIGIVQNDPLAGQAATVRVAGKSKLVVSGVIGKGAWVGTTNAGKGVAKTADHDIVRAVALEASTADGQIITVRLVDPFTLSV